MIVSTPQYANLNFKGEFVNSVNAGGLCRQIMMDGTTIFASRANDKFFGIGWWKRPDGTIYYGEMSENICQGKGWARNTTTGFSAKGEFRNHLPHGYTHMKITHEGHRLRWEGTARNCAWHGLGIMTNEADGIRRHVISEAEGALAAAPILLSDFEV